MSVAGCLQEDGVRPGDGASGRSVRRLSVFRKLVYGLFPVLVVVAIIEAALWWRFPTPHPYRAEAMLRRTNRHVVERFEPGQTVFQPDPEILPGLTRPSRFTINEFGFRSPRLTSIEKPSDMRRIFCVGGSTTACLYLDDDATWPEVLCRTLQATSAVKVDCVNAGADGDTTRDHLNLLSQRIVPFQPDVVIFMVGWNDMWAPISDDYDILRRDASSRVVHACPDPNLGQLARVAASDSSQLFRRLIWWKRSRREQDEQGNVIEDIEGRWVAEKRLRRAQLPEGGKLPERISTEEYRQNLRSLIGLCRVHGALPVLLTQATLWREDMPIDLTRLCWGAQHEGRRLPPREMLRLFTTFNDATRSIAIEQECLLVDLHVSLSGRSQFFYDDCHFTVEGARKVARLIANSLEGDAELSNRIQIDR